MLVPSPPKHFTIFCIGSCKEGVPHVQFISCNCLSTRMQLWVEGSKFLASGCRWCHCLGKQTNACFRVVAHLIENDHDQTFSWPHKTLKIEFWSLWTASFLSHLNAFTKESYEQLTMRTTGSSNVQSIQLQYDTWYRAIRIEPWITSEWLWVISIGLETFWGQLLSR